MKRAIAILGCSILLVGAGSEDRSLYPRIAIPPSSVRTILNPYGNAPLVALVDVSDSAGIAKNAVQRIDVSVTGADGQVSSWSLPYGSESFETNFDISDLPDIPADDIVVPVLGLSPDAVSNVSVEIYDDESRQRYLYSASITAAMRTDQIDPLRDGYPDVAVGADLGADMEPGMTLVSFSMGNNGRFMTRPFIMDSTGGIRWLLRLDGLVNWASPVERLENGNLVLGRGGFVYEYSMLGRRIHAWDIGRYGFVQHHDVFEITKGSHRGNLLVAVDRVKANTVEDFVIEIDRTGTRVATWDLRQVLDVNRYDLLKNVSDWLHMNALVYDERDDTLIISGRNQGVVKVDRQSRLKWILAPHKGWGKAGVSGEGRDTSPYLLTAVSATGSPYPPDVQQGTRNVDSGRVFDWPWGQHAPELLKNGNLLLFDNGFNRLFQGRRFPMSRAVEYAIDEGTRTIRQVWQYGADRGPDYFSDIISDVDTLPGTGNLLVTSGSVRPSPNGPHAYVTEITYPQAKVVFEARIGFKDAHSNLKAGGWGNIDIVYRAERLHLYPGVKGQ